MDRKSCDDVQEELKSPCATTSVIAGRLNYKLFNSNSPFRLLPNASTPPSRNFKIENPFEKRLKDKLHTHFLSPSVFLKSQTPKNEQNFKWTIEDISVLNPADIDEASIEQCYSMDSESVKDASLQEKIEKYFSTNELLPSPCVQKVNCGKSVIIETTQKKDCETQTILSLPMVLPKKLELLLQPYFDHDCDNEKSLYKRLFENHDDDNSSSSMTPIHSPLMSPVRTSPLISKCRNQSILSLCSLDGSFESNKQEHIVDLHELNDLTAKVPDCNSKNIADNYESKDEIYSGFNTNKHDGNINMDNSLSPKEGNLIEIDTSSSNTPRSKLFSSQRKKLSDSFLMEFEEDKENFDCNMFLTSDDIGYCSTSTMDESIWRALQLRASTPSEF